MIYRFLDTKAKGKDIWELDADNRQWTRLVNSFPVGHWGVSYPTIEQELEAVRQRGTSFIEIVRDDA